MPINIYEVTFGHQNTICGPSQGSEDHDPVVWDYRSPRSDPGRAAARTPELRVSGAAVLSGDSYRSCESPSDWRFVSFADDDRRAGYVDDARRAGSHTGRSLRCSGSVRTSSEEV